MTLIYTDTYYLSYMNIERSSDLKNFPLLQTSITLTLILAALFMLNGGVDKNKLMRLAILGLGLLLLSWGWNEFFPINKKFKNITSPS